MKKYLVAGLMALLILALSGTVAAEATVDTWYVDDQDNEITTAQVGDHVEYLAWVQNDENPVQDPSLTVDINSNVEWDNFESYASYDEGATYVPVTLQKIGNTLYWDISGDYGPLAAFDEVVLNLEFTVLNPGTMTLSAIAYDGDMIMDSQDATLIVTAPSSTQTAAGATTGTVPMQATGTPLELMGLAFALISAGLLYSKNH